MAELWRDRRADHGTAAGGRSLKRSFGIGAAARGA
jgi:hypothetical protein